MGLSYRRRKRLGKRAWVNVSGSGASISAKPHDRVTINSRGQLTLRLGRGFAWKVRLW